MSMIADVKEFHDRFNLPRRKPGEPFNREIILFRLGFLLEELQELSEALNNDDYAKATDALVDLIYVALGTALIFSLPFEDAWDEVHRANMRKVGLVSSRQSKRGSILDIGKPKDWVAPDIEQFLEPADKKRRKQASQLDLVDYLNERKE